ncbi:mitochondrial import receptor subunit TOM22 homolog isoform X2 [Coccinella septempunctata]|uniref:mitochondrial import receptor subunit TOM22 homolog isoform X2 n=2 Tax=Coccinella septempunctata TaxID=41139 RepID=UPI001D07D120|nr:mitochondrial import receptor subunit TOM22 homolog isoform X2 [Coccinella septempunctata]
MASLEDIDSGMESQETSQSGPKDFSPDKKLEIESDYDDEPDETLGERLWGLTEMFPESVRNASQTISEVTQSGVKNFYGFSRSAMWIVFSTSIILFAPVIFEVERAQMEEMQRSQQKQMLLGPNTAVAGGMAPMMPSMPR